MFGHRKVARFSTFSASAHQSDRTLLKFSTAPSGQYYLKKVAIREAVYQMIGEAFVMGLNGW